MKNVKKSLLLLPILLIFFAFFGITVSAEGTGTDEVDEIIDSYGNILVELEEDEKKIKAADR